MKTVKECSHCQKVFDKSKTKCPKCGRLLHTVQVSDRALHEIQRESGISLEALLLTGIIIDDFMEASMTIDAKESSFEGDGGEFGGGGASGSWDDTSSDSSSSDSCDSSSDSCSSGGDD